MTFKSELNNKQVRLIFSNKMNNKANSIYINRFGSITENSIIINHKDKTEEIPFGQIKSIEIRRQRNYIISIGNFILFFFFLSSIGNLSGGFLYLHIALVVITFLAGVSHWIGHHNIIIITDVKKRVKIKVEISKKREGQEFVKAAKRELLG